jgi:outer membrane protein assembly factor BamB
MQPFHTRAPFVAAGLLLLPPLGIILLWFRPGTPILAKIAGSLAALALVLVHLYLFFGLNVELDGTGRYPIFSFHNPDAHYEALLRSRAEQSPDPPVPETPPEVGEEHDVAMGDIEPAREPAPESASPAVPTAYWTDFRGPNRNGVYTEMEIRTAWPAEGLPPLWRQPVGGGYASFAVAQGRAFTIEQRRDREVVTAYEVETGRELWSHGWDAEFRETMGGDGPRATPTWDAGRVYALGATGELVCLEAETGQPVWFLNILEDNRAGNLPWGMAASPLIVDDKVIVLPGGGSGRSVVAYDKRTRDRIWSSLDDRQAYVAPMLVTLAGRQQILVVGARRAVGLDVADGSLLWDYPWTTSNGINSSQPIMVGPDRFFISSGYGQGAAVVEVRETAPGRYEAETVWKNLSMKNKFNSSVFHEGHIYGLDESILACIDAETGERKWKAGRYGYGQLILASGRLIVLTESGDLVLVKATPESHQELARYSALSGKTWNHPAIEGGRLLVRNATQMAAFDLTPD